MNLLRWRGATARFKRRTSSSGRCNKSCCVAMAAPPYDLTNINIARERIRQAPSGRLRRAEYARQQKSVDQPYRLVDRVILCGEIHCSAEAGDMRSPATRFLNEGEFDAVVGEWSDGHRGFLPSRL